jgi:hypothetical protein
LAALALIFPAFENFQAFSLPPNFANGSLTGIG